MKGKALNQSRNKRGSFLWMVMAACFTLTGCARFGPILLNKAVIQYDETVLQSEQQVLLLNIIRMHDDQPPHFTVTSDVKATFTLSHTGTFGPTISGSSATQTYSGGSSLTLGKTVSDSPTITIIPMQGKDFAQRLFNPIDVTFVNTHLLQRSAPRLDKMLRLTGKNFYLMGPKKAEAIFELIPLKDSQGKGYTYPFSKLKDWKKDKGLNDLTDKEGFTDDEAHCLLDSLNDCYMENNPGRMSEGEGTIKRKPENIINIYRYDLFRKVVLHIQAMALIDQLYFFSLDFYVPEEGTFRASKDQKENPDPNKNSSPKTDTLTETVGALEKNYHWQEMPEEAPQKEGKCPKPTPQKKGLILTKRYPIIAITNFDFDAMEYKDQKKLRQSMQKDLELDGGIELGEGMIIVLLLGGGDDPKNRWPIYGLFTLRNFRQVLQFLAESVIKDQPGYASEYDVAPSQFTKDLLSRFAKVLMAQDKKVLPLGCLDNPALTLTINSASEMTPPPSRDRLVDFDYNGKLFWVSSPRDQTAASSQPTGWDNPHPPRWDKEVFSMLYEIYQFNNIAPAVSPVSTSISK